MHSDIKYGTLDSNFCGAITISSFKIFPQGKFLLTLPLKILILLNSE